MSQLYVKIENEKVTQVWDSAPPSEELELWKEAIEIKPEVDSRRTGFTSHRFDTTKNPVEIIWDTYEFPIEDRKNSLKMTIDAEYKQAVKDLDEVKNVKSYEAAKLKYDTKLAAIEAATTHDELDLI
jgi:hypothetical protein